MFLKKEYKVIGSREIGMDPFTYERIYMTDYKTVMVPIWNRIIMAIIAMVVVIGGIIGAIMVNGSEDATIENIPTTVVDEISTTEMVETKVALEEATTTMPVVVDKYVCNTESMSLEYRFQDSEYQWVDGIQREIPWTSLRNKDIVMLWSMDDTMYADFVSDIALFNEYTHAGVRVEKYGQYIARENDFIVPVVNEDIEGDFAWADMGVGVGVSSVFGMEAISIQSATFRFDQTGLDNWEYHTHTVLHEMGHLFGLGHTHDEEGQQTDSIMSYESDYEFAGYLPGDIAGLKEVFCK